MLHNYLYARPRLGVRTWFHWLQRYVVADEPTQQDCFRNCFWWSQFVLHPSELSCDTHVVLSGHDSVANASSVYEQLGARPSATPRTRARRSPLHIPRTAHRSLTPQRLHCARACVWWRCPQAPGSGGCASRGSTGWAARGRSSA